MSGALIVVWVDGDLLDSFFGYTLAQAAEAAGAAVEDQLGSVTARVFERPC